MTPMSDMDDILDFYANLFTDVEDIKQWASNLDINHFPSIKARIADMEALEEDPLDIEVIDEVLSTHLQSLDHANNVSERAANHRLQSNDVDERVATHRPHSNEASTHRLQSNDVDERVATHRPHSNEASTHRLQSNEAATHRLHSNEAATHRPQCNDAATHRPQSNEASTHRSQSNEASTHRLQSNEAATHRLQSNEASTHRLQSNETASHRLQSNKTATHRFQSNKTATHRFQSNKTATHRLQSNEAVNHWLQSNEVANHRLHSNDLREMAANHQLQPNEAATHRLQSNEEANHQLQPNEAATQRFQSNEAATHRPQFNNVLKKVMTELNVHRCENCRKVKMPDGTCYWKYTVHCAGKQMQHTSRKQKQTGDEQPPTKRMRMILTEERVAQEANESLAGVSSQSSMGHEANVDIGKLPDAVTRGNFKAVTLPPNQAPAFIWFDLETTNLIRGRLMPHVTQIAAVELQSDKQFNTYVLPKEPLSDIAEQITGIVVDDSGSMTVNGTHVYPASIHFAITKFCEWLEQFQNVFLVAHNGRRFDFPVFVSCLISIGLVDRFYRCVSGLIDSLPVFKKCFLNQSSYKQEDLARTLLNLGYDVHNALEDAKVLGKLVSHSKLQSSGLVTFSFSPSAVHRSLCFSREKGKNLPSLLPLIDEGILKMPSAEKIAGSGLDLSHLQNVYERDGEDGLRNTFTGVNSDGLPRVTNFKRTLNEVIPKLGRYFHSESSEITDEIYM